MLDNENLNENVENTNAEVDNADVLAEELTNDEPSERYADRVAARLSEMEPGFKKAWVSFYTFFAIWFIDFIDSFKRNKMKIAGYLIAVPGVFIGFLLDYEIDSVYSLGVTYAPVCMFILVLAGYINIFESAQLIKNKNLSTVIIASALTLLIVVTGVLYIVDVIDTTNEQNMSISSTNVKSFITVGSSMVLSVVGCVLAFIWRDKNYKKDKF